MANCDTIIRNASVVDGSGAASNIADVALRGDRILAVGPSLRHAAAHEVEADGWVLAPGFIDVHTHDDLAVIRRPAMLPKLSQGVTTVFVGNCGISAAPVQFTAAAFLISPHPRLWETFPRVLGQYCREEKLFSLPDAVHKMTAMPAQRFGLSQRGMIREGCFADLVLFNPEIVSDTASFADPVQPARGIEAVWVNGVLSYTANGTISERAGRFLARGEIAWIQ